MTARVVAVAVYVLTVVGGAAAPIITATVTR